MGGFGESRVWGSRRAVVRYFLTMSLSPAAKDIIRRALRTFVQTLAGFFIGNVTVFDADWRMMLTVSGTAALASVANSLTGTKLDSANPRPKHLA